jgi:predicted PurR-regulated permease PerM
LKIAQPILVPVLVALFLSVLTSPAVSFLVRFKLPTGLAISIVVAGLFGLFYGLGSLLANSTDQFIDRLPDYELRLANWLEQLQVQFPWLINDLKTSIADFKPTENALTLLRALFSGVGSLLTALILILFTLIFSLLEAQSVSLKIRLVLGNQNSINYVKRFTRLVQRYLLVKSLISLATGLLVGFMLWLIGVDYPILWGALAFLMNYIPNIGSLIAAIPPIILAGIQLGWPGFVASSAGFVGINLIVGNLIEPRLMGKTLDISPLILFLSLVFWGWILGPIGMLLAIPLTVVVKIGLEVYPKTRWLAQMISQ